jgi:NAD(P)H-hydrate epimerase
MTDLEPPDELPPLKPRPADGHKGTFGYDLVIGGSVGMAGAVVLTSRACLRSGAGVVRTLVPEAIYQPVAAQLTCPLVFPLPDTRDGFFHPDAGERSRTLASESDAAGIGPGIGRQDETAHFVRTLLPELEIPTVVDADGLNIISEDVALLDRVDTPLVLTPHPGELSRLRGCSVAEIQNDREASARHFAGEHGVVLVLKGQHTVVSDGERAWTNPTGNDGLATGGAGDVLTGMVLSLLGQGYDPYEAARISVYLHGYAGDIVARENGSDGLIASDLIDVLPEVFKAYRQVDHAD